MKIAAMKSVFVLFWALLFGLNGCIKKENKYLSKGKENDFEEKQNEFMIIIGASLENTEFKNNLHVWFSAKIFLVKGNYRVFDIIGFISRPTDDFPTIIIEDNIGNKSIEIKEDLQTTRFQILELLLSQSNGELYLDKNKRITIRQIQ
jgi:hypothetical protein